MCSSRYKLRETADWSGTSPYSPSHLSQILNSSWLGPKPFGVMLKFDVALFLGVLFEKGVEAFFYSGEGSEYAWNIP